MLQSVSSVFVVYRHKTLTGSQDPTHANGTDKLCTTSVNHYKWMLRSTTSVCTKRQVDTYHSYRVICHPVVSCGSLRDHLSDHNAFSGSQGEVSGDGLESS